MPRRTGASHPHSIASIAAGHNHGLVGINF